MLPPLTPLLDYPLRDTSICLAPDGYYYLTGTTGYPTWWTHNDGIWLWRSHDLQQWEPLGCIWSTERDGSWSQRLSGAPHAIWAPEIHVIHNTFYLTYSLWAGDPATAVSGLLKSVSGQAWGPYVEAAPQPLSAGIDASLFQDDDGLVYWVYQNGMIARMQDDLGGLAEPPRLLSPANHHQVGFEGAFLCKIQGHYHLLATEFVTAAGDPVEHVWGMDPNLHDYSCFAASATHLDGPYGPRYLALPHAGHNMLFRDKQGQWWSTFFGHGNRAPHQERAAILRVEVNAEGRIQPA
jgi:xylan 1,4-beta-xylosidase